MLPACLYAAPLRRKLELLLFLPLHITRMRSKGVYNFFPEFQLLDQYDRVLRRVQAPGGSLGTSRRYLSSSRHSDENHRGIAHAIRSVANNVLKRK